MKKNQVLETFKQPKLFSRVAAFLLDAAIFLVIAFSLNSLLSFILTREGTSYYNANQLQSEHINSSHLSFFDDNRGYLQYDAKELADLKEDKLKFNDVLSYYYLSYLTGNNIEEGLVPSKNYNVPLDNGMLPSEFYTVSWYNQKVLKIGVENYFVYDEEDDTKIGRISDVYLEDVEVEGVLVKKVKYDEKLYSFLTDSYKNAINDFFKQDFLVAASKTMSITNALILFTTLIIAMLVIYIIIPITNRFGLTLGKRFMGLIVVSDRGLMIKRYQILLRVIPLLVGIIIFSFIPNLFLELISAIVILLASLTIMLIMPYRQALHDLIARTVVVSKEDAVVCETYHDFLKVYNINEEVNIDNGK